MVCSATCGFGGIQGCLLEFLVCVISAGVLGYGLRNRCKGFVSCGVMVKVVCFLVLAMRV